MKCPFCGSELEAGAGFCPACGTIISLDNEFVSPTHPSSVPPLAKPEPPAPAEEAQPEAPAAAETPEVPDTAEEVQEEALPKTEMEPLNGMPAYVSPTFEAYEPAQTVGAPDEPYDPETDDDDPFRELHPDLDDAPVAPAPVVIPPEAKISDTQPVAIEGDIPVYEPTEEVAQPEDAQDAEEADDLDDMYVTGGKGKKGKIAALLVVLLLAAAAVGAWYYMKSENPFFRPSTEPSAIISDSTEPTTQPTTAPTTEDTTDESTSDEDTTDESATDESATDESSTEDTTEPDSVTDLTADENELTAPDDTTEPLDTTTPTTAEPTTKAPTTTAKPTTTAPRTTARPTTTAPRTTARRTTTQAPTTQPANTLQRPTSTFAAKTMYVNTNGVALRYAPNSASANRVSLSVGADATVTAEQNGYCFVRSNRYGVSGWVRKAYLGNSRPVAQTQQTVSGVVAPDVTENGGTKTVSVDGSALNLRKGPGTSYDIIRPIHDGYPVQVKGRSSSVAGWVYVTDLTHGVSGWVSASYLH